MGRLGVDKTLCMMKGEALEMAEGCIRNVLVY